MTMDVFTVRAEPETVEKLNSIAKAMDRSRNWLVNQALEAYISDQQWFVDQVQKGRDSIARGDGVPHERAMSELQKYIEDRSK